jgi:hypothetical protein
MADNDGAHVRSGRRVSTGGFKRPRQTVVTRRSAMHALSRPQPTAPPRTAEIVSFAELNRARSHRALDRASDHGPVEAHPWAYCFPRTATLPRR